MGGKSHPWFLFVCFQKPGSGNPKYFGQLPCYKMYPGVQLNSSDALVERFPSQLSLPQSTVARPVLHTIVLGGRSL